MMFKTTTLARQSAYGILAIALECHLLLAQSSLPHRQPTLVDRMDGAQPVLRVLEVGANARTFPATIDRQSYRFGSGSERLAIAAPVGSSVRYGYAIPPAPVIDETGLVAWVMCNRPGTQLAAQVALPRTLDPHTGQPMQLLIRGSVAQNANRWIELRLDNLPAAVAAQARVARAELRRPVDERGAMITHIALIVPGGRGVGSTLVDRVEYFGPLGTSNRTEPEHLTANSATNGLPEIRDSSQAALAPEKSAYRMIQWQGEPFETLARLGFDAVQMGRLPSPEETSSAAEWNVALVCPPPPLGELSGPENFAGLQRVVAWELGAQLAAGDLSYLQRWQELVDRYDPQLARRTVLSAEWSPREASRLADVVRLGRPLLGADLSLREYAAWLAQRQRLARPGTPLWVDIETQLTAKQQQQLVAWGCTAGSPATATYAQLCAMISACLGVHNEAFVFASRSPLTLNDETTQARRAAIELANIRLGLLRPWLQNGKLLASARSTDPERSALVFESERSQLLAPVRWDDQVPTIHGGRRGGSITFLVPDAAESSEAYLLSLTGSKRLRRERVAGGVQISLDALPDDGLVLVTDDPQAFSQVNRYLRTHAQRALELRRGLAEFRFKELAALVPAGEQASQTLLAEAQRLLASGDQFTQKGNFELALQQIDAAEAALFAHEAAWALSMQLERARGLSALEREPTVLPARLQLESKLSRTISAPNCLPAGEFENLATLLAAGWHHHRLELDDVTAAVRLSPNAPHSGSFCLELSAKPLAGEGAVPNVVAAPVWITSPEVTLSAGDLVEITGMVRVSDPLVGSVDGLTIAESLGGPEMALRILHAPSWQTFRIVRAAPVDHRLQLTIALTGLGAAEIDHLQVRRVRPPAVTAAGVQRAAR